MTQPEPVTLHTDDAITLAATRFRPPSPSASAVLVAGGLGVPQRYYAAFAQWLAAQGHHVMTFDPRGMGASLPAGQSLREVQADMLSWAQVDFSAAVSALLECSGTQTITVVGHSLGAHHAAMTTPQTQSRISTLVSVAAGAGYWRDWAPTSRNKAPLMLHLAGPILTPLFGYFPGKRLGMVADLPAGVMHQWTRWCRHPEFAWGAEPEKLLPVLQTARYRIRALSFRDDEAMTENCTRKLLAATPNAPATLEVISPESMSVARIGHMGAFRSEQQAKLWPHMLKLIEVR